METTREKSVIENRAPQVRSCGDSRSAAMFHQWMTWGLAGISGILQVLIFPSPNVTFLCWIALAPLLVSILRSVMFRQLLGWQAFRTGFLLAYVTGAIFYTGSCYWVYHTMTAYGGLHPVIATGVLLLLSLYLSLLHGLFGGLLAWIVSRTRWGTRALVVSPFLWVAVELFRSRVVAFPWDLLGTVLVDN